MDWSCTVSFNQSNWDRLINDTKEMKCGVYMKRLSLLVVSIILLLSCGVSYGDSSGKGKGFSRAAERKDEYGTAGFPTGLKELTKEEKDEIERTHKVIKQIRLNDIGLSRINEARKKKGKKPLKGKSFKRGEDIVSELPGAMTSESAPESALESVAEGSELLGDLPDSVDNSTLKYFPPIRSQGSLGSCGCFSGTYYAMTYMWAFANDLNAKTGGDAYRLSPKFTYNMINGGANVGSWYFSAYDIGKKSGCITWADFPYDSNYRQWCSNPDAWKDALFRRVESYGSTSTDGDQTQINEIKQLLNNGYVLNFATHINSWVYKDAANDPSTLLDDSFEGKAVVVMEAGSSGYHAMTIVGYNDNIWVDFNSNGSVDSGEKGAFRIANSWGTYYGEGGYYWIAYDAALNTSAVSDWDTTGRTTDIDLVRWVTVKTDYQPRYVAKFTLNHAKRNQLKVKLGASSISETSPTSTWTPSWVLQNAGGAYAFDGTATPCDMTFYLDYTDLLENVSSGKRVYLTVYDTTSGDSGLIESFSFIDLQGDTEAQCQTLPAPVDYGTIQPYVDVILGDTITINNGTYTEGDGILTNIGQVVLEQPAPYDITMDLFSSDTNEVWTPSQVTILSNQTTATFDIEILDDDLLDGSQEVVISLDNRYIYGDTILIHDNESASLTLALPNQVSEGDASFSGTVMVSSPPERDVLVWLETSNTNAVFSGSVIISNGQSSATFELQVLEDTWIDGDQVVTITAHVENWTDGSESITVQDNESRTLVVSSLRSYLFEGQGVLTNLASVGFVGLPVTNITINLTSSDTSELIVTNSVILPAGQSSVSFDVTVQEDPDYDGMQSNITVSASASGYDPGTVGVNVYDSVHHFKVEPIFFGDLIRLYVSAQSIDGFYAPFVGSASMSALADSGPIPVEPTLLTGFNNVIFWPNSRWTGLVTFNGNGTNVVLIVDDGEGHSGTSTPFNVALPPLPPQTVYPYYPEWWRIKGVTEIDPPSANDYVAINQGQLKHTATQAYAEFASRLAGLDLSAISNRVSSFSSSNNYSAVNLGQLKHVAQPFYDVLWTNGITNAWPSGMTSGPYPWSEQSLPEQNLAIVNQGQLKYVFSFDLDYDSDGDGISDYYENQYGLDASNAFDAFLDPDGDMVPNLYEYRNGRTDPTNALSFPVADAVVSVTPTNGAVSSIAAAVSNAVASSTTGYPIVLIESGTYTSTNEVVLSIPNILIYATHHTAVMDGSGVSRCFLIHSGNPVLSGLVLQNGSTVGYGGAVFVDQGVELALLRNCIITNCEATVCSGGAVNVETESAALLLNCVLAGNTAAYGGAVCADPNADVQLINCTVINNHARVNGGGVRYSTLKNSLVWGNSADGENPQLENVSVSYSCIENWNGSETGITTNDPYLASNSWHLVSTNSSCYNAGTSTNAVRCDIDGESRDGRVDIGADQFVP
jgi:C1A family cysteine protease